jgi:hypothetical protein
MIGPYPFSGAAAAATVGAPIFHVAEFDGSCGE